MAVAIESAAEVMALNTYHSGDADVVHQLEELAGVSVTIIHIVGKTVPLFNSIDEVGVVLGADGYNRERHHQCAVVGVVTREDECVVAAVGDISHSFIVAVFDNDTIIRALRQLDAIGSRHGKVDVDRLTLIPQIVALQAIDDSGACCVQVSAGGYRRV